MVLAIELVPADDRLEGVALLPFGLALDSGVKLQIDDTPAGPPRSFRTCVPAGCLLPLSLDAHTAAMLRSGTTLKAKVVIDGGADTVLAVSLKGLSSALDRTAALLSSATDRDVAQK
jgi:invasion protein IalB